MNCALYVVKDADVPRCPYRLPIPYDEPLCTASFLAVEGCSYQYIQGESANDNG